MTSRVWRPILFCLALLVGVAFMPRLSGALNGTVASVPNGKTLVLEDGTIVRLAALQVPNVTEKTGKRRAGEPGGEQARAALERLVNGKSVTITPVSGSPDRHGRTVGIVRLGDDSIVQERQLRDGWAVVYPFSDSGEVATDWLALEAEAREAGRGVWADGYWQIRPAEPPPADRDRYLLVEGTARTIAKARGNWYINFGTDRDRDFTAILSYRDWRRHFKKADLKHWEGAHVRLRGWVHERGGPMLTLIVPEQVERLD